MKKLRIPIILVIALGILYLVNQTSKELFYDVLAQSSDFNGVEKIEATVYFNIYNPKTFNVGNEDAIHQIQSIFKEMTVKKVAEYDVSYTSKYIHAYNFHMMDESNALITSFRLDASGHITFDNGDRYKIINKYDFDKFYEIIILSQNQDRIDKFYYYILEKLKSKP